MNNISGKQIALFSSLFFNGLHAGSLLFVSTVDVRLFQSLLQNQNEHENKDDVIRAIFPVWWPAGRDLMAPLGIISTVSHAMTYFVTREPIWLYNGGLVFSVIAWTALGMRENISALRKSKTDASDHEKLSSLVKSFCNRHHFRLLTSGLAFALSTYTLIKNY
eukprot:gb/GECH01001031.1/.p1 GENE.gb/GECH01001031.1/~~gb/GECH01001031.1/.p1  ORF type:complete len:163 (+),score=30.92 gb/GECH01001031.1/:1-489(+)